MKRGLVIASLLIVAGVAMYVVGNVALSRTSPFPPPLPTEEEQQPGGFAADRVMPIAIDGKRYMGYLKAVCDIGPRLSGSPGMKKQQDLIIGHFEKLKLPIEKQSFEAKQVSRENPVALTNLIVKINPEKKKRVILSTHYDTRPFADQEPDPRKWRETFLSANDGGSGVALLMELAHHLPDMKLDVGVDLVFFDGEEFIFEREKDKYFLGSEHFAQTWKKSANRPDYFAAILFDMIAGKLPMFPAEGHSYTQAPELNNAIWRIALDLKSKSFVQRVGQRVLDDHMSLLDVGIPAIDIIDFDYRHWHRLSDTPENCDPAGPTEVARVVSVWLQRLK